MHGFEACNSESRPETDSEDSTLENDGLKSKKNL